MYDYQKEPRRTIFMIDSKSFYASVEAIERHLNPLQAILVVMSTEPNTGSGLVLAASPKAKQRFGISNVMRAKDVPKDPSIIVAKPRMNLYIKRNLEIHEIYQTFVAEEDLQPYSIDESLLDMTASWRLFGQTPHEVARKIQQTVKAKTGIYLTVGIGDNPLLAKLALDIEAKHNQSMIASWHYEDVPDKLWPITDLTRIWSIGDKTAQKLKKLNINSIKALAYANPYELKQKLGVLGMQLFAFSWGIDRAIIRQSYRPKEKSIGNSQVLPKDYLKQTEIEIVLKEISEQVAARLRAHQKITTSLHLGIGFSYQAKAQYQRAGFSHSTQITATNNEQKIAEAVVQLFRQKWRQEAVRNISLSASQLLDDRQLQLDLFDEQHTDLKQHQLAQTIDQIRQRYGFLALVKAANYQEGATAISRASLVGGHAGGTHYE